mmetsp:Transcript_13574/g.21377  ORF Transcript_13574/g.21377 Transcript_13574/m.21377 type:complete len:111 (-) Transcript_13574:213-545(-)
MWVHKNLSILKEGRIKHFIPEFPPEIEDTDAEIKKIKDADLFEPRLKSISEDKYDGCSEKSWNLRVYGDSCIYDNPGFVNPETKMGPPLINDGYLVLKSLIWPGSMTIFH